MNIPKFGQRIGIIYGLDKHWGLELLKELWPRYKDLPIEKQTEQNIEFSDGTIITLLSGRESELRGRHFDVVFVGDTVTKRTIEENVIYCGQKVFIADGENNFITAAQWIRSQTIFS